MTRGSEPPLAAGTLSSRTRGELALDENTLDPERLEELERMARLGQLTTGLLHDVNQPAALALVSSAALKRSLFSLKRELGQPSARANLLLEELCVLADDLGLAIQHIGSLLADARTLGRCSTLPRYPLDLGPVVTKAYRLVRHELDAVADFELCAAAVPPASAEEARVIQVLVNLLLNATRAVRDRADGRGRIRVTTRLDGEWVVIDVDDDGCGIPEEVRAHLFEPFVSTHSADGGRGLGLWISSLIVQKLDGELEFESEEGQGTRFSLRLPAEPPVIHGS